MNKPDEIVTIANKQFTYDQLRKDFKLPIDATIDGCNAINENAPEQIKVLQFKHYMSCFPMDGFSGKAFDKLSTINGLLDNPQYFWNANIVTVSDLRSAGFGPNESNALVQERQVWRSKGVELWRIIRSLGINGCGSRISKEYAKKMAGLDYDFTSMAGKILSELASTEHIINAMIASFKAEGFEIHLPKEITESSKPAKTYVLTGSPKSFGFKTKGEFQKQISSWSTAKNIKECDILITDDLSSSSSKMKAAEKLGKSIMTYEQAIQEYQS